MLLSCDLAFGNIGYTVWNGKKPLTCGLIQSEKNKNKRIRVSDFHAEQCGNMAEELRVIIDKHFIKGIIGELPSGSQNARAAKANGMVLGLISSVASLMCRPVEWCTPDSVKKAVCGKKNASKIEIMDRVIGLYGGYKTVKLVWISKGKNSGRNIEQATYHFCDQKWPKTKFEHIADSVGAYMALKNGNIVRMFG